MDWLLGALGDAGSILLVILGLGFLIFIHEFGHFLMAKKNKVRVEIFSLGFGQALWKWRRGETEYRISWIPLGGYVKMAGETMMDERHGEPWELTSKGAWPRLQIFTAGALMNLIIAFPIAILAFVVGLHEYSNVVGAPGIAEMKGGMKPGDIILEVDGKPIDSLQRFRIEMIRRPTGRPVAVKVLRDGREEPLTITTMSSPFHATEPASNAVDVIAAGSPVEQAGIRPGDEIYSIDGRTVVSFREIEEVLLESPGKTLSLGVRRRDAAWRLTEFAVTLTVPARQVHVLPVTEEAMEPVIKGTAPGRPAHGRLKAGDIIRRIDGKDVPSWAELKKIVEGAANRAVVIEVSREGKDEKVEIVPSYSSATGKGSLGVLPLHTPVFAHVPEGSPLYEAGVRPGDTLTHAAPLPQRGARGKDGRPVWQEQGKMGEVTIEDLLHVKDTEARSVTLQVRRKGEAKPLTVRVSMTARQEGDVEKLGFRQFSTSFPYRQRSFGEAVKAGIYEPFYITVLTIDVLRKLLTAQESTSNLSGPVGIFRVSYQSTKHSFGNFLWLLCLITVNLGVFNLLPIPILDGGHVVLLAIEKLRGRPPSEKFVATFQYVGLLFILALVVLVTYNDISKLFGGG